MTAASSLFLLSRRTRPAMMPLPGRRGRGRRMARKAVTQKYPMMVHCNPDVGPPLGAFAGVEFRSGIRRDAYHMTRAARANATRFSADEWTLLARFLEERAMEEEVANPAELLADFVEQGLASLG